MKIEAGKYYKSRSGLKVGPLVDDLVGGEYTWYCEKTGLFFKPDGTGPNGVGGICNLIEEWVDDEPNTVTDNNPPTCYAELAAIHKIKITETVGDLITEYDGRE